MSESKADYAEDEVWEAKQDDLFARGEGGAKEAFSILILDDSPYERECLVDMCQDQGYTTYAAANEERSLEILEAKEISMVLVDYHQPPPFNPVAYLRKLQRMGIAALVMSADNNLQLISECLRDDLAADFLVKPVSAKVIKKLSKFKAHNKSGSKRSGGDNTKPLVSFAGKKAAAKGKQFNVLVVDDSQYETECITQMCAESNFTTSVAHGEADATAILDSQQIDLVLLDFHMPKFNTMAYLNQLKQRGVAVVVMSGDNDKRLIGGCLDNGYAADFLVKPIMFKTVTRLPKYKHMFNLSLTRSAQQSVSLLARCNSTSSLFITSTLHVPDVDRILLGMSLVLRQMIEAPLEHRDRRDPFNPTVYKQDVTAECVFKYLKDVFKIAQWSPECNILALVLISRLVVTTDVVFHEGNWDILLLCSLLIAQKIWDDSAIGNIDIPAIWEMVYPDRATMSVKVVNKMERSFLSKLSYNVHVSQSTYTECYFELRDLVGGAAAGLPAVPLSAQQAHKLETRSKGLSQELLSETERQAALKTYTPPCKPRSISQPRLVIS